MFSIFFSNFFLSPPHRQPQGKNPDFFFNESIINMVHAIHLQVASLVHLFKLAGEEGIGKISPCITL
jgi:hypothetical protein